VNILLFKGKKMFTQFAELIETHNVFVREGKHTSLRAKGFSLLYFGQLCRQTAEVFLFCDDASREAVRQWSHRKRRCSVNYRNYIGQQ